MFVALFADGGSRGNPGPSAYGFLVVQAETELNLEKLGNIEIRKNLIETGDVKILALEGKYVGNTTNNQAEWQGLVFALENIIQNYNPAEINLTAYLDSELVVKQVRGEYKVKKEELKPWSIKVKAYLNKFKSYKVKHIYREHNKEADGEVNKVLDEVQGVVG
jgi:ribonuclease HI